MHAPTTPNPVADGGWGLQVIDVSNPLFPSIIGTASTGTINDVAVSGAMAYVAVSNGPAFLIVDVSNPTSPKVIGSVALPSPSEGVAVSGQVVYVADGPSGLQVADVSNLGALALLGSVATPGQALGVAVSGEVAYLACGSAGLVTVPAQCPTQMVVNLEASGFVPESVTIAPGEEVTWAKVASGDHTTTNGNGPLDPKAGTLWDGPLSTSSPQFVHAFPKSGSFPYFCRNHPSETGTITVAGVIGVNETLASRIHLTASPNPFRSGIDLQFELDRPERVSVVIVDIQGRKVQDLVDAEFPAGTQHVSWNGRNVQHQSAGPGLYFARLVTGSGHIEAQKVFKIR